MENSSQFSPYCSNDIFACSPLVVVSLFPSNVKSRKSSQEVSWRAENRETDERMTGGLQSKVSYCTMRGGICEPWISEKADMPGERHTFATFHKSGGSL